VATVGLRELEARRDENLHSLLGATHRSFVPIRESFLQLRGVPPTPGLLGELVRSRQRHALDVFLLLWAATSSPPHRLQVHPDFWAPLLRARSQSLRNARLALYRSLDVLMELNLVREETRSGPPVLQLLDERGDGSLYVHPYQRGERYLTLPHRYWKTELDRELDLAGKAVLLIARSLNPDGFTIPYAHADDWYGISSGTFRRGIQQLVDTGVVRYTSAAVPAARAPEGVTIRRTYHLVGDMSHERRRRRRADAQVRNADA
jgi:hypothetical protein